MFQLILCFAISLTSSWTMAQDSAVPGDPATATPAAVPVAPPVEVKAPKGAKVFFVSPKNGAKVKRTFKVKFGLKGMKIRKAGEDPNDHTTGHHHLIIDGQPLPAGVTVATDEKNIHFGKGQTETELQLEPGEHTLTLQFADGAHRSYGKKMSATIKVKVR